MTLTFGLFITTLSTIFTKLFYLFAQNTRLMDKPSDRSLHVKPTVRGGGIVFIGLPLCIILILSQVFQIKLITQSPFLLCVFLLASISFLDDMFNLPVKPRLAIQLIVALLIGLLMRPEVLNLGLFNLTNPFLILFFLVVTVIWSINHFNFMDGIDGFCALQALFLLIAYVLLFNFYQARPYQDFCFILIFSLIGFLTYNFPPAKLFMGDVGSATLGLITFCIALIAQLDYQIPLAYWFMLNAIFLFDSTITLLRRIINKENWTAPHKKHAFQRLQQSGVKPYTILLGQALVNALFLSLVILVQTNTLHIIAVMFFQVVLLIMIYTVIEKRFPMYTGTTQN